MGHGVVGDVSGSVYSSIINKNRINLITITINLQQKWRKLYPSVDQTMKNNNN